MQLLQRGRWRSRMQQSPAHRFQQWQGLTEVKAYTFHSLYWLHHPVPSIHLEIIEIWQEQSQKERQAEAAAAQQNDVNAALDKARCHQPVGNGYGAGDDEWQQSITVQKLKTLYLHGRFWCWVLWFCWCFIYFYLTEFDCSIHIQQCNLGKAGLAEPTSGRSNCQSRASEALNHLESFRKGHREIVKIRCWQQKNPYKNSGWLDLQKSFLGAQHAVHDGPSLWRQQESLRLLRKQTRALPRLCPYPFLLRLLLVCSVRIQDGPAPHQLAKHWRILSLVLHRNSTTWGETCDSISMVTNGNEHLKALRMTSLWPAIDAYYCSTCQPFWNFDF